MNEEKMEHMLSQLIRMVGTLQSEFADFKQEMAEFKNEMTEFKNEMTEFKNEMLDFKNKTEARLQTLEKIGEERHQELLHKFTTYRYDLDFIWEKAVKNERDIEQIKRQMS